MNVFEAGIIAGAPAGAAIGAAVGQPAGPLGVAGGAIAGLVVGGAAGWLYALLFLVLVSIAGVLWRAARGRADAVPSEAEMERMMRVGIRGIVFGVLAALLCWFRFGWLPAVAAALAIEVGTAFAAVAGCELR
ncbi:hypothetical protein JXA47_04645 [Candidatus Sumerlaeota bacterium]|nr:hypothetical protein [Candidatus Sumerlaeota bacterium]